MNIRGAIFDLDGTLTDSMYIWQKAPVDLMRRYGGDPPEDLARDLKEMGRREAAEYLRSRFSLSTTPEELMDTLNDLGTEEYRSRVPLKPGADRLLARLDVLMQAKVVIAVAGMEGALASVVGGLVDCPVIAVPTSVGYGANFGGLSALLSMLNSCASGVSVVNIDNGFGAGYLASMINHMAKED